MWPLRPSGQGVDRPGGELLCGFGKVFNPNHILSRSEVRVIVTVTANL